MLKWLVWFYSSYSDVDMMTFQQKEAQYSNHIDYIERYDGSSEVSESTITFVPI